jgi:hypothetical protein
MRLQCIDDSNHDEPITDEDFSNRPPTTPDTTFEERSDDAPPRACKNRNGRHQIFPRASIEPHRVRSTNTEVSV